jgi:heat shock protein HslJ
MIASRIAFLFAAAAVLAGCAIPVRTDPAVTERLVIRGEMFSPEQVELTPGSVAIVELRADDAGPAQPVAEQRRQLDGRQAPIPFELSVESSALKSSTRYVFRGAIVSTPGPVRATEPVEIEARVGVVELGSLRLWPVEQIAFGTPYLCGDTPVIFGALGKHLRMIVRSEAFDLEPAVSASGACYGTLDGKDTRFCFWSEGARARVTVRGVGLPECRAITEPELPFTARGQEPGWAIKIDTSEISLNTDFGALQLRMPRTEPQITADGILYRTAADGRRLSVSIQPRICADIATGMPHPYRVRYELDGGTRSGCGGDPRTLLTGGEWAVESIGGKPVMANSRVTILFLKEDRVAGNASCNRFMGGYKLTGEGLSFRQLGGAMMACEEPLSEQETRFLGLLRETYRFEIDPEGRLVLHTTRQQSIEARR